MEANLRQVDVRRLLVEKSLATLRGRLSSFNNDLRVAQLTDWPQARSSAKCILLIAMVRLPTDLTQFPSFPEKRLEIRTVPGWHSSQCRLPFPPQTLTLRTFDFVLLCSILRPSTVCTLKMCPNAIVSRA